MRVGKEKIIKYEKKIGKNEENMDVRKPEIRLGFLGNTWSVTTLYIIFDMYYNTNNSWE